MSQYIKDDNIIHVSGSSTLTISNDLPSGTYLLELNLRTGEFYLKQINDFKPYSKVYGDYESKVNRVINPFISRKGCNLGVMLSGTKGSGKTLTTKMISVELARRCGYPTIIINKGYKTADLAAFLHSIDVPCMVIFDEFDKVYSWKDDDDDTSQSGLLDILDGVFESRKLFVMSCNDLSHINPYFFSRPGRIFYHYRYDTISESVISQYCDDNLLNRKWKDEIMQLSTFVSDMTFDILKAVVEETNRYDESPRSFIESLNVRYGLDGLYDVELYLPSGRKVKTLNKIDFAFGRHSWSIYLPRDKETLPLTKLPRTFFREDDDDDEVYGFYTPEVADLVAVHPDGSMEMSILNGALRAHLVRTRTAGLDYAKLTEKVI